MPVAAVPLTLAAAGTVYVVGLWRLRQRTGGWARWQAAAFSAGWLMLAGALLPPLEPATARFFSAHMAQHLLLGVVAPLLLALAAPVRISSWAFPRQWAPARTGIRHLGPQVRRRPVLAGLVAVGLHAVAFWVWHAPALYRAAEAHEGLHALEHTSLFLTGAFFWWVALGTRWRSRSGLGIGLVFLAALQGGAMAALITLAPRPLYGSGPGALVDQQLGGAIMWVPGGALYLFVAMVQFVRWLQAGPRREAPLQMAAVHWPLLVVTLALVPLGLACSSFAGREPPPPETKIGDVEQGRRALESYGCGSCHTIPGVPGADGKVAPPLTDFGERSFIAGRLSNTPGNLVRWVRDPQSVDERTAMPDLDVTEEDARDIAAYLHSLQ